MDNELFKKISAIDLKKIASTDNLLDLLENIAHIRKFCKNDHEFSREVLKRNVDYFINLSSDVYIHYDDKSEKLVDAMAMVTFKAHDTILPNDLEDIVPNHLNKDYQIAKDFIEFRRRVNNAYKVMYQRNHISNNAELEIFTSLDRNKGIGRQLINMFETDLLNKGINEYFLSTNELCTHNWYLKNGYEVVDKIKVKTDDLVSINSLFRKHHNPIVEEDGIYALVYKKTLK